MSKRIAVMGMLIAGVTWLCAGSAAAAAPGAERCEGAPGLPDPAVVAGGVIDTARVGLGRTAVDPAAFRVPRWFEGVPRWFEGVPRSFAGIPVALGAPIRTAAGTGLRPTAAAFDLAAGKAAGICADLTRARGLKAQTTGELPKIPVVEDKLAELPADGPQRKVKGALPLD